MSSRPATMPKASRVGATLTCRCLPEEIVIWEILVRLPPKSLLRCRAVSHVWRRVTSTHDFLLAHHGRQPSLPIGLGQLVSGSEGDSAGYNHFLAFDHRAMDAQVQTVAQLDQSYRMEALCDGLLILSKYDSNYCRCFFICNPVTREHARLPQLSAFISFFNVLGMYLHRPTGEYRLLLHCPTSEYQMLLHRRRSIGYHVLVLGSDQEPRYIEGPVATSGLNFRRPALVHDSLHWFQQQYPSKSRLVLAFETTTESFRQIRAPLFRTNTSGIFEMDDTLGIYSYNGDMKVVDIWVLENYKGEVWKFKFRVKLPVTEIRAQFGRNGGWYVTLVSADGDVLLLLNHGGRMFFVQTEGKLVGSCHRDGQNLCANGLRLKQTLVQHKFFTTLENYNVGVSPFV